MEIVQGDHFQLPSLERVATSRAPQVYLLHGHLRQAHATNAQLRNYNRLIHDQYEQQVGLLKQKLADQRSTVEQSITAQRRVEAMAKDSHTIASAEIFRHRRRCDEAEKAVSSTERMFLHQIADLEEQLCKSKSEIDNMRLQKDALVRGFAAIANEILGGQSASPNAVAQDAQVAAQEGSEPIVRSPDTWLKFSFALNRAGELRVATDTRGSHIRPYNYDGARAIHALLAGIRRLWTARAGTHPRAAAPHSQPVGELVPCSNRQEPPLVRRHLEDMQRDLAEASLHVTAIEDDLRGLQASGEVSFQQNIPLHSSAALPLPGRLHALHTAVADMACQLLGLDDGAPNTAITPLHGSPLTSGYTGLPAAATGDSHTAQVAQNLLRARGDMLAAATGTDCTLDGGTAIPPVVAAATVAEAVGGGERQRPAAAMPLRERLLQRRRGILGQSTRPQGGHGTSPPQSHSSLKPPPPPRELLQAIRALLPQSGTLPPVLIEGLSRALATPDAQAAFYAAVGPAAAQVLSKGHAAAAPAAAPALAGADAVRLPPMTTHLNPLYTAAPSASQGAMLSPEQLRRRARCLSAKLRTAPGAPPAVTASRGGDASPAGRSRRRSRSAAQARRGRATGSLPPRRGDMRPRSRSPGQPLALAADPHKDSRHCVEEQEERSGAGTTEAAGGPAGGALPPGEAAASAQEVDKLLHGAGDNLLMASGGDTVALRPSPKAPQAPTALASTSAMRITAAPAVPAALPVPSLAAQQGGRSFRRPVEAGAGALLSEVAGMGLLSLQGGARASGPGGNAFSTTMTGLTSSGRGGQGQLADAAFPCGTFNPGQPPAVQLRSAVQNPSLRSPAGVPEMHFAEVVESATGLKPRAPREAANLADVENLLGLSAPGGAGICGMIQTGVAAWRGRAQGSGRKDPDGVGVAALAAERTRVPRLDRTVVVDEVESAGFGARQADAAVPASAGGHADAVRGSASPAAVADTANGGDAGRGGAAGAAARSASLWDVPLGGSWRGRAAEPEGVAHDHEEAARGMQGAGGRAKDAALAATHEPMAATQGVATSVTGASGQGSPVHEAATPMVPPPTASEPAAALTAPLASTLRHKPSGTNPTVSPEASTPMLPSPTTSEHVTAPSAPLASTLLGHEPSTQSMATPETPSSTARPAGSCIDASRSMDVSGLGSSSGGDAATTAAAPAHSTPTDFLPEGGSAAVTSTQADTGACAGAMAGSGDLSAAQDASTSSPGTQIPDSMCAERSAGAAPVHASQEISDSTQYGSGPREEPGSGQAGAPAKRPLLPAASAGPPASGSVRSDTPSPAGEVGNGGHDAPASGPHGGMHAAGRSPAGGGGGDGAGAHGSEGGVAERGTAMAVIASGVHQPTDLATAAGGVAALGVAPWPPSQQASTPSLGAVEARAPDVARASGGGSAAAEQLDVMQSLREVVSQVMPGLWIEPAQPQ